MMIAAPSSTIWTRIFGSKVVVAAGMTVLGVTMLLFTTFSPQSSALHVILVTMLMGVGMGNIMAPATDSIMGSLPRAKAGVGSAVNDTTRQVGGAIGVAVMGSITASIYTSHMTDKLTAHHVPAAAIGPLSDSIGKTMGILQSPQGKPFASVVRPLAGTSYVSGLHVAAVVAACVLFVGILGVLRWLPARETPVDEPVVPGAPAPIAAPAASGAPAPGSAQPAPALATANGSATNGTANGSVAGDEAGDLLPEPLDGATVADGVVLDPQG
jgi:hypothetical protein